MAEYLIPALSAVVIAIVEAIAARERKQSKDEKARVAAREARREEEMRLSMRMMDATLQLSVVAANALTGGHNNGNVERAKGAAQKAGDDYKAFLEKSTSHTLEAES